MGSHVSINLLFWPIIDWHNSNEPAVKGPPNRESKTNKISTKDILRLLKEKPKTKLA